MDRITASSLSLGFVYFYLLRAHSIQPISSCRSWRQERFFQ